MKHKYRIISDGFKGYEVQTKVWWWPWWVQCHLSPSCRINTHRTVEDAEKFAIQHADNRGIVKYLGELP